MSRTWRSGRPASRGLVAGITASRVIAMIPCARGMLLVGIQRRDDAVDVVDTPGPRAAACALQRRPETAVVGEPLVGREPWMRWPAAKQLLARLRVEGHAFGAHEVDGTGQCVPIDRDLDEVIVLNAPDGPFVERLGPDVTDAGPAREPGETPVGDESHVFAPRQVAERGGDLRSLLHAGPRRSHPNQDDDVALADTSGGRSLDCLDCLALVGEHPGWTAMTVDAVGIDHR